MNNTLNGVFVLVGGKINKYIYIYICVCVYFQGKVSIDLQVVTKLPCEYSIFANATWLVHHIHYLHVSFFPFKKIYI